MVPLLYLLTVALAVTLASVWLVRDRSIPVTFALSLTGALAGGVVGTVAGVALEFVSIGQASLATISGAIAALFGAMLASLFPSLVS